MAVEAAAEPQESPLSGPTDFISQGWRPHIQNYALSYCLAYRSFRRHLDQEAFLEGDNDATDNFHAQLFATTTALVPSSLLMSSLAAYRLPTLRDRPALLGFCQSRLDRLHAGRGTDTAKAFLHFSLGTLVDDRRLFDPPEMTETVTSATALEGRIDKPLPLIVRNRLESDLLALILVSRIFHAHAQDHFAAADFQHVEQALLAAPLLKPPAYAGDVPLTARAMELCLHLSMLVDPPFEKPGEGFPERLETLHQDLFAAPFRAEGPASREAESKAALDGLARIWQLACPLPPDDVRL